MRTNNSTGRRGFLSGALYGAFTVAGLWLYGLPAGRAGSDLEVGHRDLLRAVLDTLIPDDEYPGALRAGVPERLESQLADTPRRARLYRRGLDAIASHALDSAGKPFQKLSPERRAEMLSAFQSGFNPGSIFLHYARIDAMTTFYSSPEAYAMLGYEPPVDGYPYSPATPNGSVEADG